MNILFVCTGNTCRSAMAEGLMKKAIAERGLADVSAASCGTGASVFFRVPPLVLQLMREAGADIVGHRSTQVDQTLVDRADLILVMENAHKEYIALCFPQSRNKMYLLKEYVHAGGDTEITDPIGGSEEMYAGVARELAGYVETLADIVAENTGAQILERIP